MSDIDIKMCLDSLTMFEIVMSIPTYTVPIRIVSAWRGDEFLTVEDSIWVID